MERIPDAPYIRRAERTGYPFGYSEPEFLGYCLTCGKAIYEGDRYADRFPYHGIVCEDCALADDEPTWDE